MTALMLTGFAVTANAQWGTPEERQEHEEWIRDQKWRKRGMSATLEGGINYEGDGPYASALATLGYRYSPWNFFGVGAGYEGHGYHKRVEEYSLPVYINYRVNIIKHRVTPFCDAKLGYSVAGTKGAYINGGMGVDVALNPHLGLTAGYSLSIIDEENNVPDDDYFCDHEGWHVFMSFKVGLRF